MQRDSLETIALVSVGETPTRGDALFGRVLFCLGLRARHGRKRSKMGKTIPLPLPARPKPPARKTRPDPSQTLEPVNPCVQTQDQ